MPESAKLPGAEKHIDLLSLASGGNLRQRAEPSRAAPSRAAARAPVFDCTRLGCDRHDRNGAEPTPATSSELRRRAQLSP